MAAYRDAVNDVLTELASLGESPGVAMAERILARRLPEPEFAIVLSAMPSGPDAAIQRVLREVRTYRQSARSSAGNLPAMIRIALLAQIDVLWWGHLPAYQTDADVLDAADLLDLDVLRRDRMLLFRYRRQASSLLARAARSAERLAVPDRVPRTAGLRFACARAGADRAAQPGRRRLRRGSRLAARRGCGSPASPAASSHQRHLRSLGYAALLPSSHCVGYAADIEMAWFRQFQADGVLQGLLLDRQRAGRDQRDRRGPGLARVRVPRRGPGAAPGPRPADGGLSAHVRHRADRGHGRGRRAVPPDAGLAGASRRGRRRPTSESALLAGTQRLRIVDRERAVQPWLSPDGRWLLCYNGEIFNYRHLRAELIGLGRGVPQRERHRARARGIPALGRGRGQPRSAASSRSPSPTGRPAGRTWPATRSASSRCTGRAEAAACYVASEVKALVPVGAPVSEVPPGHHGWAGPAAAAGPDAVCRPDGARPTSARRSRTRRKRPRRCASRSRTASGSGSTPT